VTTHQPFLSDYTQESVDDLIALEGDYRLDSLILALEQALGAKSVRDGDAALSDPEGVVLAVQALQREVGKGGYWQFFAGSAAEFVPWIRGALLRIGCPLMAELTAQAMEAYGVSESMPAEQVRQTVQDAEGEHPELNLAYFGCGEDLTGQLFEFVKANRDAIHIP
jgi:hypothetical protein